MKERSTRKDKWSINKEKPFRNVRVKARNIEIRLRNQRGNAESKVSYNR